MTIAVQFTNTSTPASGLSYAWDFGDGDTSTEENPLHFFVEGEYDVELCVTNLFGVTDCTTDVVDVDVVSDIVNDYV